MKFNYGEPISQKLSDYLRQWITTEDRAQVAKETGYSVSLTREMIYRTNSVNEKNEKVVVALFERAIKRREQTTRRAIGLELELEKELKT